ncbi:hypothetical protein HW49_01180 [Porphyromonadaceae bacterium COT-184 OH4590]|nr:hypothetical protein HW49_01180 [Porphyromonadaceae bacterium COT-184 OH4590]
MKTNLFLMLCILLFAGCCKKISINPQTGLPWGWDPMPHERIRSYFPMEEGKFVTYISENGNSKTFKCISSYYEYSNTFGECNSFNKCAPNEKLDVAIKFKSSNENSIKEYLEYHIISFSNRTHFSLFYIDYLYRDKGDNNERCGGGIHKMFEIDTSKWTTWPKNPNEFMSYFTDTIILPKHDQPEKAMGILVTGKGLVWFTDYDGIKWTLKE